MAQKQTALQAAINGDVGKLSEKETRGALSQAVGKLASLSKRAESSKEAVVATGTRLMLSAETMGSLFLSSMAEGFLGPERLSVGGVDLRAPIGLLAQGYGLYEILSGEEAGEHSLALGNGVTGCWLASVAQDAGRALRERKNGATPAAVPGAAPTSFRGEGPMVHVPSRAGAAGSHFLPESSMYGEYPVNGYPQMSLIPEPSPRLAGPVREIMLTPEGDSRRSGTIAGPGQRFRRAGLRQGPGNRFPRASAAEEEASDEE